MSQNDFNLANQGFPSMRSDMNSAFQALASNSAGDTEPATTYSYQWWYDSTADVLKLRNSDNDGWISFATFDQATDTWTADINGGTIDGTVIGGTTPAAGTFTALTSTGNVGIGTDTPSTELHVKNTSSDADVQIESTSSGGDARLNLYANSAGVSQIRFGDEADTNIGLLTYDHSDDSMAFKANNAEAMRIDSSGDVLVGTTSPTTTGVGGATFAGSSLDRNILRLGSTSAITGVELVQFFNPNGKVGTIETNASSTSYITSSDYRLKENVVDLTGASARVNQLKPSRFNFIADGTDTVVDGFLAHEVATVVPEAISGTKDAVDADGNPDYQDIDQSKLVPLLTAALQEALTKIDEMETRLAALEGN